ncbi:HYDIN protein, partial [Ramphastos sulfuratus]|nr:HYDIN protein [Ramphastos sulfuratus]
TFQVCFHPLRDNPAEVDVLLPIKVPPASSHPVCTIVAGWGWQQMFPGISPGCSALPQVAAGPTFRVRLRAKVAVPSLCLSRDRLEFSSVQCGQCQEETIRLYNQLQVPCQWFISRAEPAQKVKHRQC